MFANIKKIILVCSLPVLLSSCVEAVVTGVSGVSYAVVQERSVGDAIDDTTISAKIKKLYFEKQVNELLSKVGINIVEGRVLLTGKVASPDVRVDAVRLAWQPNGVREVINEITVDESKLDAQKLARDVVMTTKIKGKFLLNKIIKSINYSVETVDATVYLMGIGQDKNEVDEAIYVASKVSGVRNVVNHVILKNSPDRL